MWSRISNYLIYVWFYIDYIRVELLQKFITATHISYIDIFGSVSCVKNLKLTEDLASVNKPFAPLKCLRPRKTRWSSFSEYLGGVQPHLDPTSSPIRTETTSGLGFHR